MVRADKLGPFALINFGISCITSSLRCVRRETAGGVGLVSLSLVVGQNVFFLEKGWDFIKIELFLQLKPQHKIKYIEACH